ncbi:hypothetical protein CPT_Mijalis043 [Citrobacter phage Mijalis]|uniref:Uncharacterized protein n=1 Tax=Citrobacter phage Mijalis TaxID=1965456 RepID=A0A1V0DYQ9_9CAUD|nr:hypothetical protein CPT_Mijalis043 [Citrobacter phage Mijalis]
MGSGQVRSGNVRLGKVKYGWIVVATLKIYQVSKESSVEGSLQTT